MKIRRIGTLIVVPIGIAVVFGGSFFLLMWVQGNGSLFLDPDFTLRVVGGAVFYGVIMGGFAWLWRWFRSRSPRSDPVDE